MSSFSTYFGHTMSTIEGGVITTNDEDIYHTLSSNNITSYLLQSSTILSISGDNPNIETNNKTIKFIF